MGAGHVPGERKAATAFAEAWQRGDERAMYALLSDAAKKRTTQQRLERTYKQAAETLTLEKVRAGPVTDDTTVPIVLETRIFGTLDTLENLKKGGRVGGAQALIGSMLSIKPIIEVRDGVVEPESKQRTRSRALRYIADKVRYRWGSTRYSGPSALLQPTESEGIVRAFEVRRSFAGEGSSRAYRAHRRVRTGRS